MAKFRVLIDRTDDNSIKVLQPVTWIPEFKFCCYCQPKNEYSCMKNVPMLCFV